MYQWLRRKAIERPYIVASFAIGLAGPALVLFAPNIRRHFGWDQVVAPPMTYPMPSRARSPPAGYDD